MYNDQEKGRSPKIIQKNTFFDQLSNTIYGGIDGVLGFSTGILDTMQNQVTSIMYRLDKAAGFYIPGNDVFEQKADMLESTYIPYASDYVEEKVADEEAFEQGNEIGQDAAKKGIAVAEIAGAIYSTGAAIKTLAGVFTSGAAITGISSGTAVLSTQVVADGVAVAEGAVELTNAAGLLFAATSEGPDKTGNVKNEGGTNSNDPQSYLDRALKNRGLDGTPAKMVEVWTEGDYKYTVRIHEGNSLHTDAESIYRVSRQSTILDSNGQGTGLEYLGTDGNWYHESILKEFNRGGVPNPSFNEEAARLTHISLGGK